VPEPSLDAPRVVALVGERVAIIGVIAEHDADAVTVSASARIPVENIFPLVGHFTIRTPMCAPNCQLPRSKRLRPLRLNSESRFDQRSDVAASRGCSILSMIRDVPTRLRAPRRRPCRRLPLVAVRPEFHAH
jgi:hypothetical protein